MTWTKTNLHAWTHSNGWKISRHWTLTKPKTVYFLTYVSQDDYWKGINLGSFSSLKEAKNSFKIYEKSLDRITGWRILNQSKGKGP